MPVQTQPTPSDFSSSVSDAKLRSSHTSTHLTTSTRSTETLGNCTIAASLTSASLLCLLRFSLSTQKSIYDRSILLRLQCLEADERAYFFPPINRALIKFASGPC